MKGHSKTALKYTLGGIIAVTGIGILTYVLTPETETGNMVRFTVPLLTGVIIGVWMHFRLRDILEFEDTVEQ